jgi:hypothetical protein
MSQVYGDSSQNWGETITSDPRLPWLSLEIERILNDVISETLEVKDTLSLASEVNLKRKE